MHRRLGLPVFGVAALGLALGHALSYVLAVPDPHQRGLLLHQTGHGYLPGFTQAAVVLALAGLVTFAMRAVGARSVTHVANAPVRGLVSLQVAAFLGQEVLERVLAGAPVTELLHGRLLLLGIAVQIAVAIASAFVLRWLTRAAATAADVLGERTWTPRHGAVLALAAVAERPAAAPLRGRAPARGPPSA